LLLSHEASLFNTLTKHKHMSNVNWLAFGSPVDCAYSSWTAWSQCKISCHKVGSMVKLLRHNTRHRFKRIVAQPRFGGELSIIVVSMRLSVAHQHPPPGKPCLKNTSLAEESACQVPDCPQEKNCQIKWTLFTECTKTCGGGKRCVEYLYA
jgi:hypothetical protein